MIKDMETPYSSRLVSLCLAIAVVGVAAPGVRAAAAEGAGPHTAGQQVVREGNLFVTATPHYLAETDISPETTLLVADHMEAVGAAYAGILQGLGQLNIPRFRVRVYQRHADYVELVGERNKNTVGLYVPGLRMLVASVGTDDLDLILGVLRHEGWHQFIHEVIEGIPPWADEGLAEYFRHSRVAGERLIQGEAPAMELRFVQRAYARRLTIPLARLMSFEAKEWARLRETDALLSSVAYCEAGLFVHFLLDGEGGRYRGLLYQYLLLLYRKTAPAQALKSVFAANVNDLQMAWERYVVSLRPSPRYVCRDNLSCLGDILLNQSAGRKFTPMELLNALLKQSLGKWMVGEDRYRPIRSDRQQEILEIFRCPEDIQAKGGISYEFRYASPEARLPEIICTHHQGYAIKLWYTHEERERRWVQHVAEAKNDK